MREHLVRLAAEDNAAKTASAMRSHDDQIALFLLRRVDDGLPGRDAHCVDLLVRDAGRLSGSLDHPQMLLGSLFCLCFELLFRWINQRNVFRVHRGSAIVGRREKADHFRADGLGESHTLLTALREVGEPSVGSKILLYITLPQ